MGIKHLKAILLQKKILRSLNSVGKAKELYVDFLGLFMAMAYSVTSTEMLHHAMKEKFKFMKSIAEKIIVFVDRGNIALKTNLREKRKQSSKNQYLRKIEEIKNLKSAIKDLSENDIRYEEKRESIIQRIEKHDYYIFLSEKKNIEKVMSDTLSLLKDVEICYCHYVDAEFKICCQAKDYYAQNGCWPAILSSDQDTMCLSCVDVCDKIIYDTKHVYRLCPDRYTVYLTRLTILVNGCDFFGGLYGISITKDNCDKYKIFEEFSKENTLKSLIYKNYSLLNFSEKKYSETSALIDRVFEFIILYTSLNEEAYKIQELPKISVKEFLSTMVFSRWDDAVKEYQLGPDILQNIRNIYKNKSNQNALQMIEYYKYRNVNTRVVKKFIATLELECCDKICMIGVSSTPELYISFENLFYFNNCSIIENPSKMININTEI
ncbi:ORF-72 [Teiidae poxvirus 1]|nr:ORF-72 [Teiidae poxvirus 1]